MAEETKKTTQIEPEETELSNQDLEQVTGGAGSITPNKLGIQKVAKVATTNRIEDKWIDR